MGRVYEVYGPESSYKTTLAYMLAGQAQQMFPDRAVVIIDAERAHQPETQGDWMRQHGFDPSLMVRILTNSFDQAFRATVESCMAKASVVIIDSYAALMSMDKGREVKMIGNQRLPGSGARSLSEAMPQIRKAVQENEVLLLILNQARTVFDPFSRRKLTSCGGFPLRHNTDIRLEFVPMKDIYEGGAIVGREVRAELRKSRLCTDGAHTGGDNGLCPHLRFYADGRTVDPTESIIDVAVGCGVVEKSGSWFSWGDHKAQGKEAFAAILREEDLTDAVWAEVHETGGLLPGEADILEDFFEAITFGGDE